MAPMGITASMSIDDVARDLIGNSAARWGIQRLRSCMALILLDQIFYFIQLNLHETDLFFRYLSHHLTWHFLLISGSFPILVCCDPVSVDLRVFRIIAI